MAPDPPAADATRICPFCGISVSGTHEGCTGLFKDVMSAAPDASPLDEMPPEAVAFAADETRLLNDYILVEQVGKGGMGTVWKSWDRKLTRWVAVKFLNGQDADDCLRFSREAKLAARLRHPNIAAVFDTGEVPSKHAGQEPVRYLSMEFIEGQSVGIAELPLLKWLDIFARIARALDHAHRSGVIHRDIKPSNLMLTREHWPYVMDFGLAKSLKAGSSVSISGLILGTPPYMPPEQAMGNIRDIGPQSDIYSLGATLYFVLTRQEPFQGEDSVDVLVKVLQGAPRRPREIKPDIPEPVEAVIQKAMARKKNQRYATAGEMADDLEKLVGGGTPALQPRSRAPVVALAVLCLAILGMLGVVALQRRHPVSSPTPQGQAAIEKPSPIPAFVNRFRELKDARRWKDARAWVDQAAGILSPGQRDGYAKEIDAACREELQKATAAFCSGLLIERIEAPEPGLRFETLRRELPAPEQLLLPHPAYDWTRRLLPMLDESKPEALLQAAAESAGLDDSGDNPWFLAAELGAHRALLRDLRKQNDRARGGTRDIVRECQTAAETIAKPWELLLSGLPAAFRKRHAPLLDEHDAAVRKAVQDFPVDPPYLKAVDFDRILNAPNAEQRLDEAERRLRALGGIGELTRESQQSLLVKIVTARALAASFQGTTADQIAQGLQEFAAPLRRLGVTEDERTRFGPKVAAVFALLLR